MGSSSYSSSSSAVTDKRQVVSEMGVGFTVDGNSNILGTDFLSAIGSNNKITVTDNGIANAAFDFANKSLSSLLALTVDRDKVGTAAATAVTNQAIDSINAINEDGSTATNKEATKTGLYLLIAGGLAGAYWLWGRKK